MWNTKAKVILIAICAHGAKSLLPKYLAAAVLRYVYWSGSD